MKKALTYIDGALIAQCTTDAPYKSPLNKHVDISIGIYARQDGQLDMGNKIVWRYFNGR